MRTVCSILFAVFLLGVSAAGQSTKRQPARQTYDELAVKDREVFDAIFTTCSPDKLGDLLTADFEFYHDKWGQTAKSASEFLSIIRGQCERQIKGTDYRARRELIKGSVRVYLMNNYGAIQTGMHRFFKITPGKKDELTETARFMSLWKKNNGSWRLARALSYDHRDPKGVALLPRVGKKK